MKILLVEDEAKLSSFVRKGLEGEGYWVDTAFDGQLGLSMALHGDHDVIILDVSLPQLNGFEVCRRLRAERPQTAILLLTALGGIVHKTAGYDAGADDYLVKPFEFQELLLRVRALYRRYHDAGPGRTLSAADLTLHLTTKRVERAGQPITLTAREYALLEYLLLNQGHVVSRVDIAEKVWDLKFDTNTNIIDVYITYLRRKIDKDFAPKLIHTVVGMGYVLRE